MAKHDIGYFAHEGLSNMFSHGFMSFAAVGITVACLLIMGTFTLVAVNANELLRDLEQENEILAYVEDTYTEAESKALRNFPQFNRFYMDYYVNPFIRSILVRLSVPHSGQVSISNS